MTSIMKYQPGTRKSIAAIALSLVVLLSVVTTGAVAGTSVTLAADDPAVDGTSTPEEPTEPPAEGAPAPSTEEQVDSSTGEPAEAPADEGLAPAPEEPTEGPTEEPVEEAPAPSPEEPADSPTEEPTEAPVEEELAPATEGSAKVPTEDPPAPSTEEPAEPPAEEASAPATEKPADSSIEEPTEAPVEEEPAPALEEPADSSTEEPTEAPIDGKSAPATEEPAEPEPPVEEESAPAIEKPSTTTEESAVTTMTATASDEPSDDFEYSDLRAAPTEATVDEPVTITVTVLNNGSAEGTFAAPLFVDGVRVDAASEAFAPGEERDVSYEWAFDEPGTYDVTVGELDPVAVNVTDGAGDGANETDGSGDGTNGSVDASYANLSVSPSTVRINGTVLASATVSNPGNETADFVAELLVDGTAVDQRTGSLAPNATVEVEFSWSPDAIGTYEVRIGDLPAQTVTVEPAAAPAPVDLDDCTTITEPGVYRLADDITLDAATCLVVLASDVVVDGDGHTLDGVSGAAEGPRTEKFGLYVAPVAPGASADDAANVSNVTVRDLTVAGWGHGIHLSNADDVTVERVTARGNR
ncbi:MAG TPA: CARDB domain-containing protein, partial [Halobacteriales archaeon]|nr:CARDB domain-containing protein [Halobacteriales archaeon]